MRKREKMKKDALMVFAIVIILVAIVGGIGFFLSQTASGMSSGNDAMIDAAEKLRLRR